VEKERAAKIWQICQLNMKTMITMQSEIVPSHVYDAILRAKHVVSQTHSVDETECQRNDEKYTETTGLCIQLQETIPPHDYITKSCERD
jgi:hypothetical protein